MVAAGCEFTGGAFLTALETVSVRLNAMQVHLQEGWLNLGHSKADQAADTLFLYHGNRWKPNQGFHEHSPEGCVCQDGCRLCSRGCSRVPRAVVQSRVPAVPQGLCAGAGTLPPARLSTQPARGAAQGAAGRRVGGRSPLAGQGPSAATAASWDRGLTATLHPRMFPGTLCMKRGKAGIVFFLILGMGKRLEAEI